MTEALLDDRRLTGGRACVTGLVLQMLVGVDRGMAIAVGRPIFEGETLVGATLTLEPATGGDHRIDSKTTRLIEQIKTRGTQEPWTSGEVVGEVLPDLVLAVDEGDERPARYRFVTNGELACHELLALARSLSGRAVPVDVVAALDDEDRCFRYAGYRSQRGFFLAIAERIGCGDRLSALWRLLAGFEAEGGQTEAVLKARVDAVLAIIVDAREDVEGKRFELMARLTDLAQTGQSITAETLLAQAGLPIDRLLHEGRLPAVMASMLEDDLAAVGYEATHDVRSPLVPSLGGEMMLVSGESGMGKSWRLAAMADLLSKQGKLAMLVTNSRGLEGVRQAVIERVWLSSFDRSLDLPGLQRRLGRTFADEDGTWLTVCVDDVQDRTFLMELQGAAWQRYGVRLVCSAPPHLADELSRRPRPPLSVEVGRFSVPQVRAFLESHGRPVHDLPGDVLEILRTPIFADLYRRIESASWRPASEYALMERFWRQASYELRGMSEAQDDIVALKRLALRLIEPSGRYPWPVEHAVEVDLLQDARSRLARTGLVRQTEAGLVMAHDRILNWLVAVAIADRVSHDSLEPGGVLAVLRQLDDPEGLAPGMGYRLGYVMLDLLWILAGQADAAFVHAVIDELLRRPETRVDASKFIKEHLAGLGPRILPALALLATESDDAHGPTVGYAGYSIAEIGLMAPGAADAVIGDLLAEGASINARKAGLAAASKLAVPAHVDRLWDIHMARRAARDAVMGDGPDSDSRFDRVLSERASFEALSATAASMPEWIGQKLTATTGEASADVLLELLMLAEHGDATRIWRQTKATFFDRLPPGRNVIPRAIGHFGDVDEAERLERAAEVPDYLEPAQRFNALVRVAPERAVRQIEHLPDDQLGGRARLWLRHLLRTAGREAQGRLLERHRGRGWEAMRDLVLEYHGDADLIDAASFEAVIEVLEARLEEVRGTEWEPRGESHLIDFLARTRRPDLISLLERRQGSRFEALLLELVDRRGRPSLCVDRMGDKLERLLLLIGGEGYGRFVEIAIDRETIFGREDGFEAALRLPAGSPHAIGLGNAVGASARDERENYDLMVALAVQRQDEALYRLVQATQACYTDALDIRSSLGPLDPGVEAAIRRDLRSEDSNLRIGAMCGLAFAPPADVAELFTDALERCPAADPSALTAVRMLKFLEVWLPASLPKLREMLALPGARDVVWEYLALCGDEEARSLAAGLLETSPSDSLATSTVNVAYALAEHEPTDGAGVRKLRQIIDRKWGDYATGALAARLADRGVYSVEDLTELAYTGSRLGPGSLAILLSRVAATDPSEAVAIARRRFIEGPSAAAGRFMLTHGGEEAAEWLLRQYLDEERQAVRWIIARALRLHSGRAWLLGRLDVLARANASANRRHAAELLGWLPGSEAGDIIDRLAGDAVPDVSDAALDAMARRESDQMALELLEQARHATHFGRWSRMLAAVEVADPYLLETEDDLLWIGGIVSEWGEDFALGVERALGDRKKALERAAESADRRR